MLREIIKSFFKKQNIPSDARFIVTVSGGADSISLLHACKYLNLNILALHCNFKLRGKESDMDEQFVKRFCDTYGIAHSVKTFDTRSYAKTHGVSIEMAARDLRYAWFREVKSKKRIDYILTGHHLDDLAETVFINYCRGTGIKGLTGIKAVNGDILRPLLSLTRQDILNYIEEQKISYRTDSSNNKLDYVRNKVRHQIIPVYKDINPAFLKTVESNCNSLKETEEVYRFGIKMLQEQIITESGDEVLINIEKTMNCPAPYSFLFETLYPYGFNKTQIKDILNTHATGSGKRFYAHKHTLVRGRENWRIYNHNTIMPVDMQFDKCGKYQVAGFDLEFETFQYDKSMNLPLDSNIAWLDADKMTFPLRMRHWQKGDKFCPLGMKKSKQKLSDFFNNQKFTDKQKKECLILSSQDNICWLAGYRVDDRYKITVMTKNVFQIKINNKI